MGSPSSSSQVGGRGSGAGDHAVSMDSSSGAGESSPLSARQRWRKGGQSTASSSSSISGGNGSLVSPASVSSGSSANLDASARDHMMMMELGGGDGALSPNGTAGSGKDGISNASSHKKDSGSGRETHIMGQWAATALCGNDVLSSCFYTIGLVTQSAGKIGPVAFVIVSVVLYLIKGVYAMAVLSFPHNGGSYNLLVHVASKPVAALGASLSIISYIATCVVSGVSACDYLGKVVDVHPVLGSVLLVVFFGAMVLIGLKESSSLAFAIFAIHMFTILILIVGCSAYAISNGFDILVLNLSEPWPHVHIAGSEVTSSLGLAIFMGFSSAMLGVSGYETSAQMIESMQPTTFVRVLRNIWAASTVINPTLAFLAISVLPIADISANSDTVLEKMAHAAGDWAFGEGSRASQFMADWISIDAFIVLSGAVLTAFVGVDGLIYQMTIDGCLPKIFLKRNRWRGTNHYIILTFLVLCCLLIVIMQAKITQLAGVYSLAFLGVLATFVLGAMFLKTSPIYAPSLITKGIMVKWSSLGVSLALICISLFGNFLGASSVIISFFCYLAPIFTICLSCLYGEKARSRMCPAPGGVTASKLCARMNASMNMNMSVLRKSQSETTPDCSNHSVVPMPVVPPSGGTSPTTLSLDAMEDSRTPVLGVLGGGGYVSQRERDM